MRRFDGDGDRDSDDNDDESDYAGKDPRQTTAFFGRSEIQNGRTIVYGVVGGEILVVGFVLVREESAVASATIRDGTPSCERLSRIERAVGRGSEIGRVAEGGWRVEASGGAEHGYRFSGSILGSGGGDGGGVAATAVGWRWGGSADVALIDVG